MQVIVAVYLIAASWNAPIADVAPASLASGLGPVHPWCMDERMSNATYRAFNYPHQTASYWAMYHV